MSLAGIRAAVRPLYHNGLRKPAIRLAASALKRLPFSSAVAGPPKGAAPTTREWVSAYNAGRMRTKASYRTKSSYQALSPAHSIVRETPRSVESVLHPDLSQPRHEFAETFVAVIPQGRAVKFNGAIITPDDFLLEDVSQEYDSERYTRGRHTVLSSVRLPKKTHFQGSMAVLMTLGQEFFGHWMMDMLPRIDLLAQAGHAPETIDWFYLGPCLHPYERETLASFGIPLSKVISERDYPHVQADRLIVPSYVGGCFAASAQTCAFLRRRFLDAAPPVAFGWPRRLYISRASTSHRRVINEAAILDVLRPLGFEVVEPQALSLPEQAGLFRSASVVVTPLGSALANFVYCRPGTKIIEFFNPRCVQSCTWTVCHQQELEYYYLLASGVNPQAHVISEDITLDPDKLLQTLALAGIC